MAYTPHRYEDVHAVLHRRAVVALTGAAAFNLLLLHILDSSVFTRIRDQAVRERVWSFDLDMPTPTPTPPPPEPSPDPRFDDPRLAPGAERVPPDDPRPIDVDMRRLEPRALPVDFRLTDLSVLRPGARPEGGDGGGGSGARGAGREAAKPKPPAAEQTPDPPEPPAKKRANPKRNLTASWAPSMSMSRLDWFYPSDVLGEGIVGEAIVECTVLRGDRVRDCELISETPAGKGFGEATLRAEHIFRLRVYDDRNKRVYNERARVRITYNPPHIDG